MLSVNETIMREQTLESKIAKENATLELLTKVTQLLDFEISSLAASLNEVPQRFLPLNGDAPIDHIHKIVGANSFYELEMFSLAELRKKYTLLFGLGIAANEELLARFEGPPTHEFAARHDIDLDSDEPTPRPKVPSFARIRNKYDAMCYMADFMCVPVPNETARTA
jgi:hypothetical protein